MPDDLASLYATYLACLNARDWDRLSRFVVPDVVHNGRALGLDGYRAMLEADTTAVPDLHYSAELVVAMPPKLASRLGFDCTPTSMFLGLPANGQRVTFVEHAFYRFADNRIAQVWSVIDKAAIEAQLNQTRSDSERNRRIVRDAFRRWAEGGSVFDILDDGVEWTIAGSTGSAATFRGRRAFLDGAVDPVARRFAAPMRPQVHQVVAEGDAVVVRWDGTAPLDDGQTYRNSYAWFFRMRDGKVVRATAFLDLASYEAAIAGARLPPWFGT